MEVRSYRGGEKNLGALRRGDGEFELGMQRFGNGVLWFTEAPG